MTDQHQQRRAQSDELLDGQPGGEQTNQGSGVDGARENVEEFLSNKGHKRTGSFSAAPGEHPQSGPNNRQKQQSRQPQQPNPGTTPNPFQSPPEAQQPERPKQRGGQQRQVQREAEQPAEGRQTSEDMEQKDYQKQMEEAEEQIEQFDQTPEQRYKERLEAYDMTMREAEKIIDQVIVKNMPFRQKVNLFKDITAVFQTRNMAEQERVQADIERLGPEYRQTMNMATAKGNLAASLVQYNDRVFISDVENSPYKTRDDIEETRRWIEGLNQKLFSVLSRKLSEFDVRVNVALSEGYDEAF